MEVQSTIETTNLVKRFEETCRSGCRCFLLKGAAGTGKTTFVKLLLPILGKMGFNPLLMAPTGRAARMLQQRTGYVAATIHSCIFKVSEEPVVDEDNFGLKLVFPLKTVCPSQAAIIVDEASMVALSRHNNELLKFGTGSLLKDLITWSAVQEKTCSNIVIFVGDPCQLNPVGEKCKTPPALDEQCLEGLLGFAPTVLELKTIHRQGAESGILEEAMRIRSGLENGRFDSFRYREHPDVRIVHETDLAKVYCPRENLNDKIIIAQSNATVWDYNTTVRGLLHGGARDPIVVDERLLNLRNTRIPSGKGEGEDSFMNGDFLKVETLLADKPVSIKGFYRAKGSQQSMVFEFTFRRMTVSWVHEPERPHVTIWANVTPIVSAEWRNQPDYAIIALYNGVRKRIEDHYKGAEEQEIKKKVRESILLRAPVVTYGYAITGHKSQGGEWKDVWVDYRYAQKRQSEDYFRWAYTVTTRARERLYAIAPPCIDNLADALFMEDRSSPTTVPNIVSVRSPRLVDILNEYGFVVSEVVPRPYAYRVYVAKKVGADNGILPLSYYIDVTYNRKNKVTHLFFGAISCGDFEDACKTIVGMSRIEAMGRLEPTDTSSKIQPSPRKTPIHESHIGVVERIAKAVENAGLKIVEVESKNNGQLLRVTIDYGRDSGFFDLYFNSKGEVTKRGTTTLPETVLKQIGKDLRHGGSLLD